MSQRKRPIREPVQEPGESSSKRATEPLPAMTEQERLQGELETLRRIHLGRGSGVATGSIVRAALLANPVSAITQDLMASTNEADFYGVGLSCAVKFLPNLLACPDWVEVCNGVRQNPPAVIQKDGQNCRAEDSPRLVQMAAFIGMSTMCYIVKPRTAENRIYMVKRWGTLTATCKINSMIPTDVIDKCMVIASIDATRIANSTLRSNLVRTIITYPEEEKVSPTIKAMLEQIRMVYKGHGMTMVQEMYHLVTLRPARKILLEAKVAEEAHKFLNAYKDARANHANMFEYLGALGIVEDSLHLRKYPNLYTAAQALAASEKRLNEGMRYTQMPTDLDANKIRADTKKKIRVAEKISEETIIRLESIGIDARAAAQEINERAEKKRKQKRPRSPSESSESEMEN
ncbi:N [San Jacinto virus]|uniref:N n=1 Tax=San Jacinto virus TaxID=2596788 RepID=A0A516EL38_9MONO|nr:N [San Jacinto virus] [San Jacinto virus]QDO67011.1 N [San Jacinto virus] [San Jacinto virus]QFQ60714.1 nucleoprotein [San Jacinto virus]